MKKSHNILTVEGITMNVENRDFGSVFSVQMSARITICQLITKTTIQCIDICPIGKGLSLGKAADRCIENILKQYEIHEISIPFTPDDEGIFKETFDYIHTTLKANIA